MLSTANYRFVDGTAGWLAHRVLTLAENHCQAVLKEHPNWKRKVAVAYHGVDTPKDLGPDRQRSEEIRQELNLDPARGVLTIVGRLNWRKGHGVLLDALEQLKCEDGMEPALLVVGYGPMDQELRDLAKSKGLSHVHFVGKQSNVLPWFLAADVALIPSMTEPFGLVAPEAMACSRPIVASYVGGLREIILDGETGIHVPAGDSKPLAAAIRTLLQDRDRARTMGERGRTRYEREFTQEAMTRRWERNYIELMEMGARGGASRG